MDEGCTARIKRVNGRMIFGVRLDRFLLCGVFCQHAVFIHGSERIGRHSCRVVSYVEDI